VLKKLIEEINKMQKLKGLSGRQFSKAIGKDPSLWSKIKNGKALPGGKFLRAVASKFPELRLAVYDYMASSDSPEESLIKT